MTPHSARACWTVAYRCRPIQVISLAMMTLLLSISLSTLSFAQIIGKPVVIDGDSLEIAGQRIRLHGIDAPESDQICEREGREWRCGLQAEFALAALIEDNWIECVERDRDRYGRIVAIRRVGGVQGYELNRMMVAEGWAVAYRRYSKDYVADEEAAQKQRRGLWSGKFIQPEAWRRQNRR